MGPFILEEASSSSSTASTAGHGGGGGGGRAIDRHNPIIRDEKRLGQALTIASTSTTTTPAVIPNQPHHHHNNKKKNPKEKNPKPTTKNDDQKRKSIVFFDDDDDEFISIENISTMKNSSNIISPANSSRYLLSNKAMFNVSSEFDSVLKIAPAPPLRPPPQPLKSHNGKAFNFKKKDDDLLSYATPPPLPPPPPPPEPLKFKKDDLLFSAPPPSTPPPHGSLKSHHGKAFEKKKDDLLTSKPPSPPLPSQDKVVVLEVSLHCRGCERKLKKHISKIQGVKSFKIEFAAKKLTVVGDVTPLAVLTSVLKVKNAKMLTPATISSPPGPYLTDSNFSEIKNQFGIVV